MFAMFPLRMLSIVALRIILCESKYTCPLQFNPVLFHPPEIVAAYGESVLLNCSSAVDEFEKISLTVQGTTSHQEPRRKDVTREIGLFDWNMAGTCSIKINDTHECHKDVDIIIYSAPEVDLVVKTVKHLDSESLYELQCDILNVAPARYLVVRWFQNGGVVQTQHFSGMTKAAVNESAVLSVNVSRGEEAARVKCEARLEFGLKESPEPAAAVSNTLNLTASLTSDLGSSQSEGAPEHHYTTPPSDYPGTTAPPRPFSCTASDCSITQSFGNTTRKSVSNTTEEATRTTPAETLKPGCVVTPEEVVVRYGDSVALNCSTDDTSATYVNWETPIGKVSRISPRASTLTIQKVEEWEIRPICYATFENEDSCKVTPNITVYKTPDRVTVSAPDAGPMIEGKRFSLSCDITNVAPAGHVRVKWYRGDSLVLTERPENLTGSHPLNVLSVLTVAMERRDNGSEIRCEAELQLGPKWPHPIPAESSPPYLVVVHYKPFFKDCPSSHAVLEDTVRLSQLSCDIGGNPPPSVEWYLKDRRVTDLNRPLTRRDSGRYKAAAHNSVGENSTYVDITVEYAPGFNCTDRYQVLIDDEWKTLCDAEGVPTPKVTWFRDGQEVFPAPHWKKLDSGDYTLRAANTHGEAEHALHLDVLYPPEFSEGNTTVQLISGGNMTLRCDAEGNPKPEVKWSYTPADNLHVATVGRQKIISIRAATSTNAGLYICVATNTLGRATKSISLTESDKTSFGSLSKSWWWMILLIVCVGLMVGLILLYQHKKRRGMYHVVGNKIPMTSTSI